MFLKLQIFQFQISQYCDLKGKQTAAYLSRDNHQIYNDVQIELHNKIYSNNLQHELPHMMYINVTQERQILKTLYKREVVGSYQSCFMSFNRF